MNWALYLQSLCGGFLIGGAAALFLLLNGRIAGISGILGSVLEPRSAQTSTNLLFLLGLLLGPLVYALLAGHLPRVDIAAGAGTLVLGGFLVGFGTRLGSGCTSGHGVCGLARLSPRSFAAVGVFMAAAIVTVFVTRHLLSAGVS
ncbi:MAG TPA: YeeE/YedE family protein [Rhodopila sp.]|uniref:YeeE/YedE family protein n=1 Tax=Rhodopila sp. TaxID=2480087 RepID=UPI002B741B30|nr:YeeE/YedE family protein [Rhodopila sp.]HVY16269.1 YeeE/YedE family protein [Rhodopila sp.]